MSHSLISGTGYLLRGLGLLGKPGIRAYAVIPLLINIAMFAIGVWYGYVQFQGFTDWLIGYLPSWLQWVEWILIPLFVVTVGAAIFFTFSIMANIVGAPFNSILAERVERHLLGSACNLPEVGIKQILIRLVPIMWNEINKIGYSILWAIPFLILFLIPGLNIAAPIFWFMFSAWMLAIQYADIPMGNHEISGKEVRRLLREKRAMSMGFGGLTLLMTSIPFVNFLVMPTAVAGATIMWVEALAKKGK